MQVCQDARTARGQPSGAPARAVNPAQNRTMTRLEIERYARALPEEDRVELAYVLLEDVVPALTPEQEREADRRIAAYRRNPGTLVAEDEALARLKNREGR